VENVVVRFGQLTALESVSLSLKAGVTALLGENGAGKTTLLRVFATLLEPAAGTLLVDDRPLSSRRDVAHYRARIGYMPQVVPTLRHLTVRQFLEYFAYLKGIDRASAVRETTSCLRQVGLADKADERTTALSGGMQRRMGLAVALLGDPQILLLDEPTAGLDPVQRVEMRELVQACSRSRPVLLSTHLSEDVRTLAERTVVLHSGRVIFDGSLTDLTDADAGRAGTAEQPTANEVEAAFIALVRSGGARA
jgi:ABC-2 type transport system ATP-binding protein